MSIPADHRVARRRAVRPARPGVVHRALSTGVVRFRRHLHSGDVRGWWREVTGLVLPAACGGCGRPRTQLCGECAAELGSRPSRVRPTPEPEGLPAVYAAAPYENAVRAVLLAHKERGALGLVGALGGALAGAVREGAGRLRGEGPLLLVPMPSPPRRR